MKKRIISLCAAAAMAVSCMAQVFAAPTELETLITSVPGFDTNYKNVSVDVPADIELKLSTGSAYGDGPITQSLVNVNAGVNLSYRATLYMQAVKDEFDDYWTTAKALININKEAKIAGGASEEEAQAEAETLLGQLNNVPVTGEFTVTVKFPSTVTIPDAVKNGSDMAGFNEEAKQIFKEVGSRVATSTSLQITIAVKGPDDESPRDYVLGSELYDNGNYSYLSDLVFTCDNVKVAGLGEHKVTGEITGTTKIGDYTAVTGTEQDPISTVNYKAVQITDGHPGDAGRLPADGIYESVKLSAITGGGGSSSSGSSGSSSTGKPTTTPAPISTLIPKEAESDAELNTEDHFAYIIGDENGLVRPTDNISRAEVATIFYRLFTDETRNKYWSQTNAFTDVSAGDWYNNAISTLANAKILNGYDDGTFKPEAAISRAEFAAIVSRITDGLYEGYDLFGDISNNWAREYINRAAYKGWVQGDGKMYRPDESITRAETMTLVNNVLIRHVSESGMSEYMTTWPDNKPGTWYYTAVQEATNSHNYEREDGSEYETWVEVIANRDWATLEQEWESINK